MSLIKIFANEIELDIVRETLSITKENNALTNDFKVSYSSFPFLIVENLKTKQALGGRDITSAFKSKTIAVFVEELNKKYYGELQILSYLNGFRKVTLKYATELLTIMDKNISSFMPIVSIIPEEMNPVPFSEESDTVVEGWQMVSTYVENTIKRSYPEVKFNFPMMYWKNKFGVDLQPDDPWFSYKQHVNYFDENGSFISNTYSSINNIITTSNENVIAPQIYLLSPLFYALKSLGWTMSGNFVNSEFIKKILFLSTKNNLCKTVVSLAATELTYPTPLEWISSMIGIPARIETKFILSVSGKYKVKWMFKLFENSIESDPWKTRARIATGSENFTLFVNSESGIDKIYSGEQEFDGNAGDTITIVYYSRLRIPPLEYKLSFEIPSEAKDFYQFHPTMELGRYVPEWTFGNYLNELKKFFNLKIDIDDFRKKLILNFNEEMIVNSEKEVIKKSLAIENYDETTYDAFHLKFQNEIDNSLWVKKSGAAIFGNQKSDFYEPIESKFKLVPNNGYTAELSEELENKDGVGIMIYDSELWPYIKKTANNQILELNGTNGIYEKFWKKWLKFRLNAIPIEKKGYFTETELAKIEEKQRVYIDRQDYLVSSLEYSETTETNFEVLLKLESVNF